MPYHIRDAVEKDLTKVTKLLDTYMRQYLNSPWMGTKDRLYEHFANRSVRVVVAESGEDLIGFAAWLPDYDLHHCVHGVRVIDFYVVKSFRGLAVGPAILAKVSSNGLKEGASYIRGEALDDKKLHKFYARVAVKFGSTYNVSGRAFHLLAELVGKSPKEIVQGFPTVEMNYQE